MANFNLQIVIPTKTLASTEASEVIIPATWGQMDILPLHTDFITALTAGEVIYVSGGKRNSIHITGGVFSVSGTQAMILADGLQETSTNQALH